LFSHIRPQADRVTTTNGLALGPISFMRLFNLSTDCTACSAPSGQDGFRPARGSRMAIRGPTVLFLDTINRANPTPHRGSIEATNPCGEQPLLAYESCTLGSINVAQFLTPHRGGMTSDYARLAAIIPLAVRFLDNVLDRTRFPLSSIETHTKQTRKIGLGLMGFADLLIRLGIPHDTEEALRTATG
jgi:ribonucleotide reductase alpha subunit